jgi:hypothetical protein
MVNATFTRMGGARAGMGGARAGMDGARAGMDGVLAGMDGALAGMDAVARRPWARVGGGRGAGAALVAGVVGAEAEELDRVVDGGEPCLGGDPLGPLLDDAALDLDAAAALAAGEVVVM